RHIPDFVKRDPTFKVVSGVVRISASTGKARSVCSSHLFQYPIGVALSESGALLVNNIAFPGQIVCINQRGAPDKVISKGGYLHFPLGIVSSGHYAYVTDVATEDQNFGIGAI